MIDSKFTFILPLLIAVSLFCGLIGGSFQKRGPINSQADFNDYLEWYDSVEHDYSAEPNAGGISFNWRGHQVDLIPGPNGVEVVGDDFARVIYNCLTLLKEQ